MTKHGLTVEKALSRIWNLKYRHFGIYCIAYCFLSLPSSAEIFKSLNFKSLNQKKACLGRQAFLQNTNNKDISYSLLYLRCTTLSESVLLYFIARTTESATF